MKNRLDKNKYLRKLKFKRLWRRYERYVYLGVSCLVIAILGIYFAHSKFSASSEEEVIRTVVGDFIHGDVVIGAYIDGEYSLTIPSKNDGYVVKTIVCDNNAVGKWDNDEWGILVSNMTKRAKCNVYFETKKTFAGIIADSSSDTTKFATDDADKNVRYIGANPDNYVYFNCSDYNNQSDSTCEKWRIIGVFNNVTKSDGTKENLVKIIRDESIGNYSWDYTSSGSYLNDWSNATLQTMLNSGAYYNGTTGTYYNGSTTASSVDFTSTGLKNDTTRNAIESVVWNLGGLNSSSDRIVANAYKLERGTTVYSGRPTTWTGKIGLMYPSDYGYATSGGSSTNRSTCLSTTMYDWDGSSDCYSNDYLYKSGQYQWTLAPYSGGATGVFSVRSIGAVCSNDAYYTYGVRPALYLKSNISIADGNGSNSSPYQLNLE